MKIILLNASPRKNWNTAQLLQSAQKGAESVGAETEFVNLYDLNFTGCRSCLACKRIGAQRNKCYWHDDLSPLIEKILSADAVIIGTPIQKIIMNKICPQLCKQLKIFTANF